MKSKQKMDNAQSKLARQKSRQQITLMLALITLGVWVGVMVIKYVLSLQFGYEFIPLDILDSVLDNVIGILPPIIIFNFAYEYLMQDLQADELSEQITKTLMGNDDSMELFDAETKRNFLNSTLISLLGPAKGDMMFEMTRPYLEGKYNLKKQYNYVVRLEDCPEGSPLFTNENYIGIREKYTSRRHFVNAEDGIQKEFKIAFLGDEKDLDRELQDDNFIFREDLTIRQEELEQLIALTDGEKLDFITKYMKLNVTVEGEKAAITHISIDERGFIIAFQLQSDVDGNEILVDIEFVMPQIRKSGKFLASISEPTYSPAIEFIYDERKADVIMIPFLNMANAQHHVADFPGRHSVVLHDEWLMPMSGVVFVYELKDQ